MKCLRLLKYLRPWNVCAHDICIYPKYLRIYKISAPHQECSHLIIYDSNKAPVDIFAANKRCMRLQMLASKTLTIWARQNLQLLTPSQSGWRALSQMVLPLLHAVLKWNLVPQRLFFTALQWIAIAQGPKIYQKKALSILRKIQQEKDPDCM